MAYPPHLWQFRFNRRENRNLPSLDITWLSPCQTKKSSTRCPHGGLGHSASIPRWRHAGGSYFFHEKNKAKVRWAWQNRRKQTASDRLRLTYEVTDEMTDWGALTKTSL